MRSLLGELKSTQKRAEKVLVGYQTATCDNTTSLPKLHHSAIPKNLKFLP